ncbi:uncharacterized protein BYT42DRAFT_563526 [Radiomyces spectabilis]|uniref:uncharacterized protein n=1 Tax=Radiomyces spectabilis TaxID=64574 RepID=UPI00221E835C|nr:uncharacterized protein BYT42DRAFT_563526 [Radiomyces spectabilis]KAI8384747.1 hypothetical protein BYT42DRAFT_563526 [Radiomyces spectabilis]
MCQTNEKRRVLRSAGGGSPSYWVRFVQKSSTGFFFRLFFLLLLPGFSARLSTMLTKIFQTMESDVNEAPITMRALLPKVRSGALIGIGGNVHQLLESKYNVRLYLNKEYDDQGRLVSVVGQPVNVAKVWREALSLIYDSRHDLNYGEKIGINFLIPLLLANKLQEPDPAIERDLTDVTHPGRCLLAHITQTSRATTLLKHRVLANTTEKLLQISVENMDERSMQAFEKALTMVAECFQKFRREALSPRNIYYVPFCEMNPPVVESENDEVDLSFNIFEGIDKEADDVYYSGSAKPSHPSQEIQFHPDEMNGEEQWHNDFIANAAKMPATSFSEPQPKPRNRTRSNHGNNNSRHRLL